MSRIGTAPIEIPSGVTVELQGQEVTVKGPKGELKWTHHRKVKVKIEDNIISVTRPNEEKFTKSLHGLTRSIIANMIEGVSKGFEKKLEVIGVGYRFQVSGSKITLNLGHSHPIEMHAPEGVNIEPDKDKKNILVISGADKQLVGQFAADIRSKRPPEPYKGKGVKYLEEIIRRKAGKTAAS